MKDCWDHLNVHASGDITHVLYLSSDNMDIFSNFQVVSHPVLTTLLFF